jgi:hypothetical protein
VSKRSQDDAGEWRMVTRYRVKWVGFPMEQASWERAERLLVTARDAVMEYEARQADERGEPSAGVEYQHSVTQSSDGGDGLLLQTVLVQRAPTVAGSVVCATSA